MMSESTVYGVPMHIINKLQGLSDEDVLYFLSLVNEHRDRQEYERLKKKYEGGTDE